jgi:hypothetical protein
MTREGTRLMTREGTRLMTDRSSTDTVDPFMEAQHNAQLEGLAIGLEQRGEKSAAHIIRLALKRLHGRAQRAIDSGGPVTGEQEPVGWQRHVGENCWTQCDRPSDEELRTKPDNFRPVYLGRMISAPASHDFRNSGESDLSVTPDCAGAGTGVPAPDCGALEDLISTFEQMPGYPEGDSNDPCFDLCGMPCCNEFGCLHAKVRAVRALALPSTG